MYSVLVSPSFFSFLSFVGEKHKGAAEDRCSYIYSPGCYFSEDNGNPKKVQVLKSSEKFS